MLKRIWAMIQKEFIQTYRDKSTLGMLLVMPLLQLYLFGFAIDMNVDHIPTIVADQSLDSASRDYVDAMVTSGYLDVIEYVSSQQEVVQAIDMGRARAGFVIPPDFDSSVERGTAQVLFLIDGSDLFAAQSAYSMATVIAQAHSVEVMMGKIERSGLPISAETPLDVRTRILYNPNMIQMWFVIPAMVAVILQTQSIAMTAQAVVREREVGTIEQLLVTPIRPLEWPVDDVDFAAYGHAVPPIYDAPCGTCDWKSDPGDLFHSHRPGDHQQGCRAGFHVERRSGDGLVRTGRHVYRLCDIQKTIGLNRLIWQET